MEVGRQCGLPPKKIKRVGPGEMDETVVLGMSISESRHVLPLPDNLAKLLFLSLQMLLFRTRNRKQVERLLGSWAWILLLSRLLFLEALYGGKIVEGETFSPSRRMEQELHTLCALTPVIEANLRRPYAKFVIATEVSTKGCGVSYAEISQNKVPELRKGLEAVGRFVCRTTWVTAISHKWSLKRPIHILEGKEVILGLKWFLRTVGNHGRRVVFLVDNMAFIWALKKGKSSHPSLNKICRRVASLVYVGDFLVEYLYIASADNPADESSRSV